jgi:hypothetical protein
MYTPRLSRSAATTLPVILMSRIVIAPSISEAAIIFKTPHIVSEFRAFCVPSQQCDSP